MTPSHLLGCLTSEPTRPSIPSPCHAISSHPAGVVSTQTRLLHGGQVEGLHSRASLGNERKQHERQPAAAETGMGSSPMMGSPSSHSPKASLKDAPPRRSGNSGSSSNKPLGMVPWAWAQHAPAAAAHRSRASSSSGRCQRWRTRRAAYRARPLAPLVHSIDHWQREYPPQPLPICSCSPLGWEIMSVV